MKRLREKKEKLPGRLRMNFLPRSGRALISMQGNKLIPKTGYFVNEDLVHYVKHGMHIIMSDMPDYIQHCMLKLSVLAYNKLPFPN